MALMDGFMLLIPSPLYLSVHVYSFVWISLPADDIVSTQPNNGLITQEGKSQLKTSDSFLPYCGCRLFILFRSEAKLTLSKKQQQRNKDYLSFL